MMKTKIPISIVPIEDDGFHLQITLKVNGKKANFTLDTGASRTVFDENRIHQFIKDEVLEDNDRLSSGLGTNTMTSKKIVIESLVLKSIEIKNYEATIINLEHVNASYQKLDIDAVDGVLGSDILKDYNAIINYGKSELILSSD